jgi:arsenite methyltransferase
MSAFTKLGIIPKQNDKNNNYSKDQDQTKQSFGFQWSKRDAYESETVQTNGKKWLIERYCNNDIEMLKKWLSGGRKIILDAGCGAGYSSILFFGDLLKDHDYLGVDISQAVHVAQVRFQERGYPGDFLQNDLNTIPIPENSVDIIFSEGVLHHTDSTEKALKNLTRLLKPGGRFLFYVYAKKAVVREFTDDHIRHKLESLSDEEAWNALYSLSKLGKALGDLKIDLDVPEDIPYLEIKKGKINLQRFFYWNICKMFYDPNFSLEEMNHMNFDWFRPLNCFRHTPEEIKRYCHEASLEIEHMNIQEAGITVVAKRI